MDAARPPFLVRHADVIFSIKTFAAATMALLIALRMDLPRPYWAMATVYITSQPLAGATASKALFRVGGTLIGAVAAVVLVPNLVNAPELLSLAIALWVGCCLYLSLLDRTPRSYMFMLGGYTVALIGFPTVTDPSAIFDTATARSQEIILGIICATLVSTIVLPRGVGPAVAARVDRWLSDARRLSRDVIAGRIPEQGFRDTRLRLAADAVEIDLLADHLAYDRSTKGDVSRWLRELRPRMLLLLPVLSSIDDRLGAIRGTAHGISHRLADLLENVSRWVDAAERQSADRLRAGVAEQQPRLGANSSWDDILLASLLIRIRELIDVSQDCRVLNDAIRNGRHTLPSGLAFHPEGGVAPVRHRDHGMALWSAAGAVLGILVCSAFWIGSGWPDGASAPMMAAVACSFFAAQDDPAIGIRRFAIWSLVAIAVVAVYLFGILPAISHVEMLIVALAPTFLVFGFLIARPATNSIGLALAANSATLMAIQNTYGADFSAYANSAVAFATGMVVAAVVTRLARSVGAEWSVRRLMSSSWTELAIAAEQRGRRDRAVFAGLMINRIGLLAPRLASIPQGDLHGVDTLRELRVGLNIVDLRRSRHEMSPGTLRAMDAMLDQLALALREHHGGAMPLPLLDSIDRVLAEAMNEPDARADALIGLVGIRRGLFPDAPAYRPETSERIPA
jgi:uncharacterized membrane protein YccC